MNKLIALLLALVMVLSLSACDGDQPAETQGTSNQNNTGTTQSITTEATESADEPCSFTFTQYGNAKLPFWVLSLSRMITVMMYFVSTMITPTQVTAPATSIPLLPWTSRASLRMALMSITSTLAPMTNVRSLRI